MTRSVVLAGLMECGANGKLSSDRNVSAAAAARTLTLRDQARAVVLRGTLALPALPPAGKTVEGTWTIATQADSFPDSATAREDGRSRGALAGAVVASRRRFASRFIPGETMTSVFHQAVIKLLAEAFAGPPGREAFMFNPGDAGLMTQVEKLTAAEASVRPTAGKTTIAQHVDHVLYGLDLLNRWAGGEENPWATADWSTSWNLGPLDDAAWTDLLKRFRTGAETWRRHVGARTDWDETAAAGAVASVGHTMYHFGAIRQLIVALGRW